MPSPQFFDQLREKIETSLKKSLTIEFEQIIDSKVEKRVKNYLTKGDGVNSDIKSFVNDHKDWLKGTLDQWADQFQDDAQVQADLFNQINQIKSEIELINAKLAN